MKKIHVTRNPLYESMPNKSQIAPAYSFVFINSASIRVVSNGITIDTLATSKTALTSMIINSQQTLLFCSLFKRIANFLITRNILTSISGLILQPKHLLILLFFQRTTKAYILQTYPKKNSDSYYIFSHRYQVHIFLSNIVSE